jgi:hypothetical protein
VIPFEARLCPGTIQEFIITWHWHFSVASFCNTFFPPQKFGFQNRAPACPMPDCPTGDVRTSEFCPTIYLEYIGTYVMKNITLYRLNNMET